MSGPGTGKRGKDKKKRKRRKVVHTARGRFPQPPAYSAPADIHHAKQRAFLAAYARVGNITAAAAAVGVNRHIHPAWMKASQEYVDAFAEVQEAAADYLEQLALFRAQHGSDTLIIFLLKGARPKKYRERFEHSGEGGGPIQGAVRYFWGRPEDEPPGDVRGVPSNTEPDA